MSSSGSSSVSALSTKAILLTAVAGVALSVGAYLLYRKHKESKDVAERTAEGRQHFSAMAETYDNHPAVKVVLPATVKALTTVSAAGGVLPFALSADTTDVLDFGCGTGSLALALASHVRSVLAVDTAPGMIEVVKKRIAKAGAASGAERVVPWLADVQSREDLPASHRSFDLIVSSLAFHHIANPKPVLDTLVPLLKPGGALVLVEMERSEAFTNALRSSKAKGHGGHGHGHGGDGHGHSHGGDGGHGHSHGGDGGHGHSHGGGHGHSHGGGEHGHSHGGGHGHSHGGSDEKKNAGGVGSSAPPDVFHAGFEVPALVELVRGAGLSVDTKATTGPAGAVVSPFVAIPTPGGDAPACLVVGIKQSKAKTN